MKLLLYFFVILALLSGCASSLGRVVSDEKRLNTKQSKLTDGAEAASKQKTSRTNVAENATSHVNETMATDQLDQL